LRDKALNIKKLNNSIAPRIAPRIAPCEEALNNMKKRSKPIILYNLDHTVYGKFYSIVEAAKHLKCHEKTIIRALKSEKKILKRRWIVKYINI
jgi:hypothetical protein